MPCLYVARAKFNTMETDQKAELKFWKAEAKKAFQDFVANRTRMNRIIYEHAIEKRNDALYNYREKSK